MSIKWQARLWVHQGKEGPMVWPPDSAAVSIILLLAPPPKQKRANRTEPHSNRQTWYVNTMDMNTNDNKHDEEEDLGDETASVQESRSGPRWIDSARPCPSSAVLGHCLFV